MALAHHWRLLALAFAIGAATGAQAEMSAELQAEKDRLEVEQARLALAKSRAELSSSLVPNLKDYKLAKPDAPVVEATAATIAFQQSAALAAKIAEEVDKALGDLMTKAVLLNSERIMELISAADSVGARLDLALSAVESSNRDLQDLMDAINRAGTPGTKTLGAAAAALPAVVSAFFSVASTARTQYTLNSKSHTDLASSVLRAKVASALSASGYKVYDPDAYIPVGSDLQVQKQWAALDRARKGAKNTSISATKLAKTLRDANAEEEAELLDSQAKVLSGVVSQAEKLMADLMTPDDQGTVAMVAAQRGSWLRSRLEDTDPAPPARLNVTALLSATDLVAADGFVRGLRIAVSGNTIGEWSVLARDGQLRTGIVQACAPDASKACARVLIRPDDEVSAR
ncbi:MULTISPECIES: hypothetical protein [Delftia]|uniref:Uncharacterized protein n=1 Tax=Delftia lacustris TaxID=558537 RepID=A0A1H3N559_9BURK|nr:MULTISPECIES: hypothetical protein [Delftia]QPS78497.1 hypothetical protein I6G48_32800 [Delftia acidovorans]QPS85056.1 hypothetical protein I6G47_33475 [Delftia lacustris]SDY83605.1 hypothetical protein SAMN05421547_108164 [Delftia lacustris]